MGDQNVTFIAGMLMVCVQNYKALLPRPGQRKPTWGGNLPLRGSLPRGWVGAPCRSRSSQQEERKA